MLPIILMSILCQGHAVDYGTDFVTAFPENLAFYFPDQLILKLKLTTFLPSTNIMIVKDGVILNNTLINTPQVSVFDFPDAEVNSLGVSGKSIRITSDQKITVLSYSKRGDSIQTNVVPPTTALGMGYLIPSLNYTELAVQLNTYNTSVFTDSTFVPMDFSYRLLIINAEEVNNTVTVTQRSPAGGSSSDSKFTLGPFALTLLPSNNLWFQVLSTAKVAVILTNPCMDTQNCRCNLVAHQLRPTNLMGSEFIFPSYSATGRYLSVTSDNTVDLSSGSEKKTVVPGSMGLLPFLPGLKTGKPLLTTSQAASVRVISPGLIIDLLPNTMFSGCFLVHTTPQSSTQAQSKALLIVSTAGKNDIHMDTNPLTVAQWNDTDIGYSWAEISLQGHKSCIFWNPTTPFAVYVFDSSGSGVIYGGPAISLNDEPDPNGCVVVPTVYELSNTTMSWQAARAHCRSQNLILASPDIEFTQHKLAASLNSMNVNGDAWLGLRRSLVTSDWYWNSKANFSFAMWNYSQPSSNLCVSIRMDQGGNFTWSSMRCCSSFLSLCAWDMVKVDSIVDVS